MSACVGAWLYEADFAVQSLTSRQGSTTENILRCAAAKITYLTGLTFVLDPCPHAIDTLLRLLALLRTGRLIIFLANTVAALVASPRRFHRP